MCTIRSRREFLRTMGFGIAAFTMSRFSQAFRSSKDKPNVILIMTDDQGWGDIHAHGNEVIETPVLDRMIKDGASFDRFYVSPVCAPTRASLLTGRYHLRTGVHGVTRGYETMRANEVTVAQLFQQAGYATGCFGKWHNGAHYPYHPNGKGFEEFLGFCAGHWSNYFDTTLDRNGIPVKTKGYITDVLTDAALSFIEQNRVRRFFCYIPYNAPHSPWQAPDKYYDKYKAKGLDNKTACAYGMCENIDDNVGRLFRKLDELQLTQKTMVLFLTDNGPSSDRYNGKMKGRKGSSHEGGIRVPLIVKWPGQIKPGTRISQITAHIDILPTLVELCGIRMSQTLPIDGISLAPLLKEKSENWPDRMLFTRWGNRGSVRTQRWRAVTERNGWQLYDMAADPSQKNNIAKQNPEVVRKLRLAYESWLKDVMKDGLDPIPIPIGYSQRREVVLQGHEAFLNPPDRKGISYHGRSGWANDWITNWTSTQAYPFWEIDVVKEGTYEITLMYVCSRENVGSKIRVEIGSSHINGTMQIPYDPKPIPSPDRVERKEVFEKVWAPLRLGTVKLTKGRSRFVVRALTKPGKTVMDLKAVHVRYTG